MMESNHDTIDEVITEFIGSILGIALPAYTLPAEPAFTRRDIPMLDGEEYVVRYGFPFRGLSFELRFVLGSDRHSNRKFLGIDPVTTVGNVTLTCEGRDSKGTPFVSTWDYEAAEWSTPLPLA